MKFKFKKAVAKELQKKVNASEFLLTVNYPSLQEEDFGFFTSYLNKSIKNLEKNIDLINNYKVSDYLRLQFDSAYCKLYSIEPLPAKDIFTKLNSNSIEKNLSLEQAIDLYFEEIDLNRDLQNNTVHNYKNQFSNLKEYFKNIKDIKQIDEQSVKDFNKYLSTKVIITVRKSLIRFYKTFFDFLLDTNHLDFNYFNKIKIKSNQKSKREAFSSVEVVKLINIADNTIKKKKKDTDLALTVRLAAYTGCRIDELAHIKMKDINLEYKFFIITLEDTQTKKHKRIIPIHDELLDLLKLNFEHKKQNDFLIYNNFSLKSRHSNINQAINRHFITKHRSNKNLVFHSFRHSFRVQAQVKNPELDKLIDIVMAHSTGIGFGHYGHDSADWVKLTKIVNDVNYSQKFHLNNTLCLNHVA